MSISQGACVISISHPANMGQGHILGVWALLHIITVSPRVCNPPREESLDLGLCSDSGAHRALVAAGAAAALPDGWDSRCQGDPVALCLIPMYPLLLKGDYCFWRQNEFFWLLRKKNEEGKVRPASVAGVTPSKPPRFSQICTMQMRSKSCVPYGLLKEWLMLIENTNKQRLVLRKSHGELKQMSAHKGAQAGRAAWRLLQTQPKAVTEPFSPAKFVEFPGGKKPRGAARWQWRQQHGRVCFSIRNQSCPGDGSARYHL